VADRFGQEGLDRDAARADQEPTLWVVFGGKGLDSGQGPWASLPVVFPFTQYRE